LVVDTTLQSLLGHQTLHVHAYGWSTHLVRLVLEYGQSAEQLHEYGHGWLKPSVHLQQELQLSVRIGSAQIRQPLLSQQLLVITLKPHGQLQLE
jgi:hypothetical protein